jgi:hypothetical protein
LVVIAAREKDERKRFRCCEGFAMKTAKVPVEFGAPQVRRRQLSKMTVVKIVRSSNHAPVLSASAAGYRPSSRLMATPVRCKSCGSKNLDNYSAEIALHFRGLANINKPHVFLFPSVVVCLDCGMAEFVIPERGLLQLTEGRAAGA